jgi:hypothetical protein
MTPGACAAVNDAIARRIGDVPSMCFMAPVMD